MNLLAFETSTSIGSISLFKKNKLFGTRISQNQKKHSEFITRACEELLFESQLELDDIDLFAVDRGPGSFTGVRVSVSAVRTYAHLLSKPIYAESSLKILATQTDKPCLCILNAQKNLVYLAAFDEQKNCLIHPMAIPVTQIESLLTEKKLDFQFVLIGDGYSSYKSFFDSHLGTAFVRDSQLLDYPNAEFLARLALENQTQTLDWKSIIPLYIRASEAEENLRKD